MKNILMTFVLSLLFVFTMQAQEFRILKSDTISNGTTHSHVMDLQKVGEFDSILVHIQSTGEIDIDTFYVHGGTRMALSNIRGAAKDTTFDTFELIEGATLTINNADGTTTIVQSIITVTAQEGKGYNLLKFFIVGAAAGNDATDQTQNYIVYIQIYRTYYKQI